MNKLAVIRIIVFVLTWVNSYLVSKNLQPLPVVNEEGIAYFLTFVISVWTLIRDNKVKAGGK